MDFSRLERAEYRDVEKFLKQELSLNDYQYRKMVDNETLRFSDFYFFVEKKKAKKNFLWRLTLPVWLLFCLLLIIWFPIKWLFTGNRYLPRLLEDFYFNWKGKIGWG